MQIRRGITEFLAASSYVANVGSWSKILAIMYLIICLRRPFIVVAMVYKYCELCQLPLFLYSSFLSFQHIFQRHGNRCRT
jgi:hypothetical protein